MAGMDHGGAAPAFSGGAALSKGWGLIQRFSEDIDFKVTMPEAASRNCARDERRGYRDRVIGVLESSGFTLVGEPKKGDENRFFSADFRYPSVFDPAAGLRPDLRVEMTLTTPVLPPIARPIRSLIASVQGLPAKVAAFPCVDRTETAADKLSALVWRVLARRPGSEDDDPTIVRHLHDLAALKATVEASSAFCDLAARAMSGDAG
jgi:predicted nucleotidyltransferase component of viral defense system